MITQLNAINATLALGGWRTPPIGAWVRLEGRPALYEVFRHYRQGTFVCRLVGRASSSFAEAKLSVAPGVRYALVKLPEGCPPFEEWKVPDFWKERLRWREERRAKRQT